MLRNLYSITALTVLLLTGPAVLAQPANDDCATAISIACDETLSGSTTDAVADDIVGCGTDVTAPGVWYRFEGVLGQITATTCPDAGYDTKINVFRGECGSLTCIGGNDDIAQGVLCSSITFVAEPGYTYYILVNGYDGATGDFDLAVTCAPIDEDDCLGALQILCGQTVTGSTADASSDAAADCITSVSAPGIWYVF
ncbi:MAG TPA: hypothetical protein VKG92_07920, partial [Flavobacteriales bacterium]|nr:hypothetical protein [Flavobacteriales bacterium]